MSLKTILFNDCCQYRIHTLASDRLLVNHDNCSIRHAHHLQVQRIIFKRLDIQLVDFLQTSNQNVLHFDCSEEFICNTSFINDIYTVR